MPNEIDNLMLLDDALMMVNAVKGNIKNLRSKYEFDWEKWYKHYHNISYTKFYEGRADVFAPETFNCIETNAAYLHEGLMPGMDFFQLVGRDISDEDKEQAYLNTELLKYQFERAGLSLKLMEALRYLCTYGTVVLSVSPYQKIDKVVRQVEQQNALVNVFKKIIGSVMQSNPQEVARTLYGLNFEIVPLQDFYIDPRQSIETAPGVIRSQRVTFDEIETLSQTTDYDGTPIYSNIESLKDDSWKNDKTDNLAQRGVPDDKIYTKHNYINLDHYWGQFDLYKKGEFIPCHITVANGKQVIRCKENMFEGKTPPFIATQYIKSDGEFYGIGIAELIEQLQIELNDTRNQILDSKTFRLCRMWKVQKGQGILKKQLKVRPNGIIEVDSMNAVEAMDVPAVEHTGYEAESIIKEDIRTTANAINTMQGLPNKYKTSATETMGMKSGSDLKNKFRVRFLESSLIQPLVEKSYQYNQQFITNDMVFSVLGEEGNKWLRIKPEYLDKFYDVIPMGSQILESRYVAQQQLINFFNITSGIPPNVVKIEYREILRRIWEGFGFRNSQAIIPDAEPPQVIMELLKEYESRGIPPAAAALMIMDLAQKIGTDMAMQQMPGQQQKPGAPTQEQPQATSEVDQQRTSGDIKPPMTQAMGG